MRSLWSLMPVVAGGFSVMALIGCQAAKRAEPVDAGSEGRAIPAASLQRGASIVDLTGGDLGIGGGFLIGAAPIKSPNMPATPV